MNDERPIEKLLRRYAKKRGDEAGPPPELHPATRRLLQGEVARQYPRPETERKASARGIFTLLAQRWIFAVGVFVVLGVAAVMMLSPVTKSRNGELLAQKSPSGKFVESEAVSPASASAIAPATPPAEALPTLAAADEKRNEPQPVLDTAARNLRLRDERSADTAGSLLAGRRTDADALKKLEETKTVSREVSLGSATRTPGSVPAKPAARSAGGEVSADTLAFKPSDTGVTSDSFADARQRVTTTAAATPAASAAPSRAEADKSFVARGGGVEKDAERFYSQSFANVVPEQLQARTAKAKADAPITPVLASFQIQQAGNELRVIDSDGSTYRGALSAAAANYVVAGSAFAARQQTQDFFYRVEGTNRTLNQNVVFTWNFVETNALASSQSQSGSIQPPVQFPAQLQNSLIYGRAQFGPGQEIEVNAVPVKP